MKSWSILIKLTNNDVYISFENHLYQLLFNQNRRWSIMWVFNLVQTKSPSVEITLASFRVRSCQVIWQKSGVSQETVAHLFMPYGMGRKRGRRGCSITGWKSYHISLSLGQTSRHHTSAEVRPCPFEHEIMSWQFQTVIWKNGDPQMVSNLSLMV